MQAYQCLHCLLTESVDTVDYVDKQKMLRLDCTDVHAYLGPVVQSIVSLTSLLVVKMITVLVSIIPI